MVHFAEINQGPSPYSMLQYIGRVATPKLVPRNCPRYLQTTLIMGGGGLVSEFMWGIVDGYCGTFSKFFRSCVRTWIRSHETFAHMRQGKIFPLFKMKWNNKVARESSEDHLIKLFKPIHIPCLSTTKNWRHINPNLGRLFWSFFYGEGVWRVKLLPSPSLPPVSNIWIKLETCNLLPKYTHGSGFRKYNS